MTPTRVEVTIRLPELDSGEAQAALSDALQQMRLNLPDAKVELAKVTDTNDAFDSVRMTIEVISVTVSLYEILKSLYGKK